MIDQDALVAHHHYTNTFGGVNCDVCGEPLKECAELRAALARLEARLGEQASEIERLRAEDALRIVRRNFEDECVAHAATKVRAEAALARAGELERAYRQACTNLATIRPDLTREDFTVGEQADLYYDALLDGWAGIEGYDRGRLAAIPQAPDEGGGDG